MRLLAGSLPADEDSGRGGGKWKRVFLGFCGYSLSGCRDLGRRDVECFTRQIRTRPHVDGIQDCWNAGVGDALPLPIQLLTGQRVLRWSLCSVFLHDCLLSGFFLTSPGSERAKLYPSSPIARAAQRFASGTKCWFSRGRSYEGIGTSLELEC